MLCYFLDVYSLESYESPLSLSFFTWVFLIEFLVLSWSGKSSLYTLDM